MSISIQKIKPRYQSSKEIMKLNNISINALSILWHNHSKTTCSACSLHCAYLPLKNQSQISKQPWHQRLKNTQFWMAESIFALMTFSPMVFSRKHWFFQIIGLYQFWARMILTSYTIFKPLSTNNPRLYTLKTSENRRWNTGSPCLCIPYHPETSLANLAK